MSAVSDGNASPDIFAAENVSGACHARNALVIKNNILNLVIFFPLFIKTVLMVQFVINNVNSSDLCLTKIVNSNIVGSVKLSIKEVLE
jgi:hypothetical protein